MSWRVMVLEQAVDRQGLALAACQPSFALCIYGVAPTGTGQSHTKTMITYLRRRQEQSNANLGESAIDQVTAAAAYDADCDIGDLSRS